MEMLLLLVVGFLPTACNLLANAMVSFACAMQVQTFRKVNGYAFASTMCIGNIRSGMESLCVYGKTKDKENIYDISATIYCLRNSHKDCTKPVIILESSECLQ